MKMIRTSKICIFVSRVHVTWFGVVVISFKDTLACATAMLTEATEQPSDMEVGTASSVASGIGCSENEDATSSRSKSSSPVVFSTEPIEDYDTVDKQLWYWKLTIGIIVIIIWFNIRCWCDLRIRLLKTTDVFRTSTGPLSARLP
jgi:hypothetical protein